MPSRGSQAQRRQRPSPPARWEPLGMGHRCGSASLLAAGGSAPPGRACTWSDNQRAVGRALARPPRWPCSRPCAFSSDTRLCRWRRSPPCARGSRKSPGKWKLLANAQHRGTPALPQGKALPLWPPRQGSPASGLRDVLDRKRGTNAFEGGTGRWCPVDLSARNDLADCREVEAFVNSRRRARLGRRRGAGPDQNGRHHRPGWDSDTSPEKREAVACIHTGASAPASRHRLEVWTREVLPTAYGNSARKRTWFLSAFRPRCASSGHVRPNLTGSPNRPTNFVCATEFLASKFNLNLGQAAIVYAGIRASLQKHTCYGCGGKNGRLAAREP